ncbi:MAG: hypothetical protein KGS72_06330 [Cyanobacteria bacterium REEB67]|jgi:hypothetical protein|nr:hypothetical protein [Cyanobacteria bacterium REEB67]
MLSFYIFQFVPIVLVEAVVLWRMKWGSLPLCIFDSLLMNFASFLGLVLGLGPYITGSMPWGLTLFGTYSVMVEGTVLMLLERREPRVVWAVVLIANLLGCTLFAIETLVSSIPKALNGEPPF